MKVAHMNGQSVFATPVLLKILAVFIKAGLRQDR